MQIRWNPWNENDLMSFFADRAGRFAPLAQNGDAHKPVEWSPAVDVHEDAERILILADLPGVEDKDLTLSVENNVLTVRGERKLEREDYQRVERRHGSFQRSFTLPPTIATDQITATMKAGVLTLTLPRKPETQPRTIKVSTAS